MRAATWIALPLLGGLARRSPRTAGAIVIALVGTVGVAHGANDDRILARLAPAVPGGRPAVSLAYAALAFATFALARRNPRTAARGLGILAWYHFGSGDVALARRCASRRYSPFETFVRGGLPLAGRGEGRLRPVLALAVGYAAAHAWRRRRGDALDVAVPALVLAAAPAPLGFAAYFGAWHAPRHLAVVLEDDTRAGCPSLRLRRFAGEAARNTALALATGAAAFALLRERAEPAALLSALTLGVTVPHQCVVWYAERRARGAT